MSQSTHHVALGSDYREFNTAATGNGREMLEDFSNRFEGVAGEYSFVYPSGTIRAIPSIRTILSILSKELRANNIYIGLTYIVRVDWIEGEVRIR